MEHRFGETGAFGVGVEEELLLVDPETHALAPVAAEVLAGAELPAEVAAHEAFAAEIELRSAPSASAPDAVGALREARQAACRAGATLLGVGLHPAAEFGDVAIVGKDRYRRVEREMRGLIRRTPECALHVHVGMPDPETTVRVLNGMRAHMPLLAGLAANSPFWFGRDSGFASIRGGHIRAYPGRGIPPVFTSFQEYEQAVERMLAVGELEDGTMLWWDVRPNPKHGTVEVREMDAQASLEDVAALSALCHALALEAAEEPPAAEPPPPDVGEWSSFRAIRDGLDSRILDRGGLCPLREVASEVVERVRPRAREAGAEDALEGIERIVREGGGADRQRAAFDRGGMETVLDELLALTAA